MGAGLSRRRRTLDEVEVTVEAGETKVALAVAEREAVEAKVENRANARRLR